MSTQHTLTGEDAGFDDDAGRPRPTTMLYCTDCADYVLRSNQFDHACGRDYLVDPTDDRATTNDGGGDGLPADCRVNTKEFTVEFTEIHVEHVTVEASDKGEAKRLAEHERSYDGEFMETMHTDVDGYFSDFSQASTDYLERVGLLPTNWSEGDDA